MSGMADGTTSTPATTRPLNTLREFAHTQNSSAVVLLAATVVALVWANSPWSTSYEDVWHTELSLSAGSYSLAQDARHWINDGLMALFFFVVGLEIRREFDMGELRERRRVATPVIAALGGMLLPAAIYLAFNAGETSATGWGIVMGTDTAFAIGVLTLVRGASPRVRAFLLTLVVVDDVVALTVIAVAYTDHLSIVAFALAVVLFGCVLGLRSAGVQNGAPYLALGVALWLATLQSGVHATIAGVVMGLVASAYPPSRESLARAGRIWRSFREEPTPEFAHTASRAVASTVSPNERLQHAFHPWASFVIVPVFALANAGVHLTGDVLSSAVTSPITIGIVCGLVLGKMVGITGASFLASRRVLGGFPMTVPWPRLFGVSTVAGIGFTMSLLIADISFEGEQLDDAKVGVLAASVIAALVSWVSFRVINRMPSPSVGHESLVAPPIRDLSDPVDPEVDHIRGDHHAPVSLVEYGDFECPYCGLAEPVLRALAAEFGSDLRFVFRHLPLTDVHEHAQLAAEASEAAASQGKFWEMHDVLFAHQEGLLEADLYRYAEELHLDVDRFRSDLQGRKQALRVERDMASADDSGAAGTPTFFINGHRHQGRPDVESLSAAVRRELDSTIPS